MKHKDTLKGGKREKNDHYNQSNIYDDNGEQDYQEKNQILDKENCAADNDDNECNCHLSDQIKLQVK